MKFLLEGAKWTISRLLIQDPEDGPPGQQDVPVAERHQLVEGLGRGVLGAVVVVGENGLHCERLRAFSDPDPDP